MADDYFHITLNTRLPWSNNEPMAVGSSITTTDVNPFFNYYISYPYPRETFIQNGATHDISRIALLGHIASGNLHNSDMRYVAGIGHETAKHFCTYVRELIWESVRTSEFPELPSRQKCIWLTKGEDNLHYWIERLGRPAEQITVFKVLPDGRMHTTSETHLSGDAESYLESVEKSRRYWRGEIDNPLHQEILFEGTMLVESKVSI